MTTKALSSDLHDSLSRAMRALTGSIRPVKMLVVGGVSSKSVLSMASIIDATSSMVVLPLSIKEQHLLKLRSSRQHVLPPQIILIEPWHGRPAHAAHWLSHPSQLSSVFQDALRHLSLQLNIVVLDAKGYEAHAFLAILPLLQQYKPHILLRFSDLQLRQHNFCANFLLQWCKALGYQVAFPSHSRQLHLDDVIVDSERHPAANYVLALHANTPATSRTGKARLCLSEEYSEGRVIPLTEIVPTSSPSIDRSESNVQIPKYFRRLRYLFAHFRYPKRVQPYHNERIRRLNALGFHVEDFTVDWPRSDFVGQTSPPSWSLFPEAKRIELAWRRGDKTAFAIYDHLAKRLDRCDVLISLSGAGLHPEFVRQITCFKIFTFFNDPESDRFSEFFAPAYDYAFTGNVNCLPMYRSWGCTNISWLPGAVAELERDTTLTEERILSANRNIDTVFLGERDPHRDLMLVKLLKRFPKTVVQGDRWPSGFISNTQAVRLYQRSRISWSIDQSVGPASNRNFRVPANGVLLVAHNRSGLDQLYHLGEEAIGFDTVEECMDYTRYFLEKEDERCRIAVKGWKRAIRDYTFEGAWGRLLASIAPHIRRRDFLQATDSSKS